MQFKFEHHQTRHCFLHRRNQNLQRQLHLHQTDFLHLYQLVAFLCYQASDLHQTSASLRIPHFHLTYNYSRLEISQKQDKHHQLQI